MRKEKLAELESYIKELRIKKQNIIRIRIYSKG